MRVVTLDLMSRRQVLSGAATVAVGGALAGAARAAGAKSSQKSVEYQSHPKAGHSCNTCKDFQPPQACKTVDGYIEARGWCDKYTHS